MKKWEGSAASRGIIDTMTKTEYSRKIQVAEALADQAWLRGGLDAMQEEGLKRHG